MSYSFTLRLERLGFELEFHGLASREGCLSPMSRASRPQSQPRLGRPFACLLFNVASFYCCLNGALSEELTSSVWFQVASRGIEAAWAGGSRGREVMDRLFPLVPSLLSDNGIFYLVTVKENDNGIYCLSRFAAR